MRPITYSRAADVDDALALAAANPASTFLAGGTNEVDLIRAGKLRPVVDRVMPFADVRDAHRAMEEREQFGKIVLVP
jgi:NADPH:quinone reductase-like Zn-dependent oxidoreductase